MPDEHETQIERSNGTSGTRPDPAPSVGDLMQRLTSETALLVQQELDLAKAEVREAAAAAVRDAVKGSIGFTLAWAGALALAAFLVIGIGGLLANYWLSALLVGVTFLGTGALVLKRAADDLRHDLPRVEGTQETLRDDAAWAKAEVRKLQHHLDDRANSS